MEGEGWEKISSRHYVLSGEPNEGVDHTNPEIMT